MFTSKMYQTLCFILCSSLIFNSRFIKSDLMIQSCPNSTLYDSNSTSGRIFRSNLITLLSVLAGNASSPNGFYSFTAGQSNDTAASGLFLCRGDLGPRDCDACVKAARSDVLRLCPDVKGAILWYDNCMLRYSNRSIIAMADDEFELPLLNPGNATDQNLFGRILTSTLDQIESEAGTMDVSGKKYAARESNVTGSVKIYALGQCTPGLSSPECRICLRSAVQSLPSTYYPQGARVLLPNCNIRYEIYMFYRRSATALPPPDPSPPPPPPPPPPAPTFENYNGYSSMSTGTMIAIIVVSILVFIVITLAVLCITARKRSKTQAVVLEKTGAVDIATNVKCLQYSFSDIKDWTNNFAEDTKLGGGGFGNVYKATLPDGQEIAVKRLSRESSQGTQEFVNEISLLSKIQHRNLVQLLGYCLEEEEKMLVYEHIPEKSLDYFLFEPERRPLLNWLRRYNIIIGVAKGLLYLHEGSHLKIIHRDLKASNVLLDHNMNPKIADFGMARLFGVNQSEGNTKNIAGTYGYMSPEYAMHGIFSVKSDVFSFGVLILEIISGTKNTKYLQSTSIVEDLSSIAWKQWNNQTPLTLLDPIIGDSYNESEVIQCIHVGLLCVQDEIEKRPTMTSVVRMLNNDSITLPIPTQPRYLSQNRTESDKSSTNKLPMPDFRVDDSLITEIYPR